MAQDIIAQVGSGPKQVLDNKNTVYEVATHMGTTEGYTSFVNDEPAEMSDVLSDNDTVNFTKAVKGGLI